MWFLYVYTYVDSCNFNHIVATNALPVIKMPICSRCHCDVNATEFSTKANGVLNACCSNCLAKKRAAIATSAKDKLIEETADLPDFDTALIEVDNAFQKGSSPLEIKIACTVACSDPPLGVFADTQESNQKTLIRDYYGPHADTVLNHINECSPYRWT
jgi:hypothetical protein